VREPNTRRRWIAAIAGIAVATLVLSACASGSSLTGKTWKWTASTTVAPPTQSKVPDPSLYTVEFLSDGTFQAKADCNTVSGTYTSTTSQGLHIYPGPSTLAACGPDSLSAAFIADLGQAIAYTFFRSEMTINLSDLGTMTFE
jgi:heat shock protein HslJ